MASKGKKSAVPLNALPLPDPYGEGFEYSEDPIEHTRKQWSMLEKRRITAGQIARHPLLMLWRTINGFCLAIFAFASLILPSILESIGAYIFLLIIPAIASFAPTLIAGESAWHAIQARISLREQGGVDGGKKHALSAQPGMDRIIESLRDQRRNNFMSTFLSLSSLGILMLASAIAPNSLAWNLALLLAMTLSIAQMFHALFTYDFIRQQGDSFPSLVFHSPTHHPTQLGSVLGDLLEAHLDPDLYLEWENWQLLFRKSLIPGHITKQALERLLYILHLHMEGDISTPMAHEELKTIILEKRFDELLLDDEARFNWRTIQRLIAHSRGWQPGAFLLLERLQHDLIAGSPPMLRAEWRMDVSLDEHCYEGAGNLFITLSNQTFESRHVRVEVLTPNGEPESRDHRFELAACPPPTSAVKLFDTEQEDALDWIPRYLERGVVLWIGVAWPQSFRGPADVQVILRDDDGIVLESQVIRTTVSRSSGSQLKSRMRQLDAARKRGEIPLPKVNFG
tara:strand:- start:43362 stop:44894 length:1533 start_codon:yes stop_codon:yes gene_type:complete